LKEIRTSSSTLSAATAGRFTLLCREHPKKHSTPVADKSDDIERNKCSPVSGAT
jgi:hypothetical protein